ncbi:endonuclease III domain-containing protein [Treponema primitia]|uniref:endonuclease III domain-containing protein n=1 Tax=Treponema primitia TaxID=88058 RepID=UPI0002555247|nr:endonuclease III [Treponema primitia]
MGKSKTTDWDGIVKALEKWRKAAQADEAASDSGDPSVSTVAERYHQDPWAVLASTILSLRTKDEVTLVRSQALLKKAPTPKALLKLTTEEIEKLIYPVGFYHTKAQNLQNIASIIIETYRGQVPADMDLLLALPGVGRKTANLVLTEAFDMDGICVDVHVHRITNRLGALQSKTPEETEMILRKILPRKYWKRINKLLVLYGQRVCRPISPFCSRCVITDRCSKVTVDRAR